MAKLPFFRGLIAKDCEDIYYHGASLDSRSVEKDEIFFAVRGLNANGNKFAQDALNKGAAFVVMDDFMRYEAVKGNKVLVKDSKLCLMDMGRKRLMQKESLRIAVTGSFGKTGTKDMLALVFSAKYKTYATKGNHNNDLGIHLTACGMPLDMDYGIFELGTNSRGEIKAASKLVRPNIAVLTGLGNAHVGNFGSVDEVAREKLSVVEGLEEGGVIIAHEVYEKKLRELYPGEAEKAIFFGTESQSAIRLKKNAITGRRLSFDVETKEGISSFSLKYPYPHLAVNAMAVITAARLANIPDEDIAGALTDFTVPKGRGNIIEAGGFTIIDDCYNASLEAVLKSVAALNNFEGEKFALIGGIGETGELAPAIYKAVMDETQKYQDINFILSGDFYEGAKGKNVKVALSPAQTEEALKEVSGTVLVKASHSFGFEHYVEMLVKQAGNNAL